LGPVGCTCVFHDHNRFHRGTTGDLSGKIRIDDAGIVGSGFYIRIFVFVCISISIRMR
jgi:hypothetical protein